MCLVILKEDKPKIATEDIIVYKFGRRAGPRTFRSDCTHYEYPLNKENPNEPATFEDSRYSRILNIERGYHSYIKPQKREKNHIFIIPKGSTYYAGGVNCDPRFGIDGYVSDNIIWMGRKGSIFTKFRLWRRKKA